MSTKKKLTTKIVADFAAYAYGNMSGTGLCIVPVVGLHPGDTDMINKDELEDRDVDPLTLEEVLGNEDAMNHLFSYAIEEYMAFRRMEQRKKE